MRVYEVEESGQCELTGGLVGRWMWFRMQVVVKQEKGGRLGVSGRVGGESPPLALKKGGEREGGGKGRGTRKSAVCGSRSNSCRPRPRPRRQASRRLSSLSLMSTR